VSHQCIADAFKSHEAIYRAKVLEETWGHLAPKENKTYKGFVIFALGCFGSDRLNPTVLQCELGDLDGSPWLYDALIEFLQSLGGDEGRIYRWDGKFRNYEFRGTVRQLRIGD
jgi:hypothetical protein